MSYQNEEDYFLQFINSLQELCESLPENSEERQKLEELLESWEEFKREKERECEYAQEVERF